MGSGQVGYFPEPKDEKSEQTYGEIIAALCPDYLAMGMTLKEYWDGDIANLKYVRKAHELRKKEENFNAWLHGLYIYNALQCVSPMYRDLLRDHRPEDYFKEPLNLYPKRKARSEEERIEDKRELANQATIRAWVERANRLFAEKHKEEVPHG